MKKLIMLLFITSLFVNCKNSDKKESEVNAENEIILTSVAPSEFMFKTPALQKDFARDASKQSTMDNEWDVNLTGFTDQGIAGNSWNATNDTEITNYFNPANVGIPSGSANVAIQWNAMPGRIDYYYPNMASNDKFALADTGLLANGSLPPLISADACNSGSTDKIKYGPYGPRGFQDEYCEWSVTRNSQGKITRIDFTCENPEYWNTVWNVSPDKVLELYQNTLGKPFIAMEDLYMKDSNGNGVIDPSTGNYLYNPLNKYNNGSGGAMHLTSTPNTIQTEIGLGTSASINRKNYGTGFEDLLCCGQFGQKFRNSDPTIGGSVNAYAAKGMNVSLANPPGLYIQRPTSGDFKPFTTPDGTDPETFWTTVRGQESLPDVDGLSMPGNYILHAKYEVPESLGYTVGDIIYKGAPVAWGSQIAQLIDMHIIATAYKGTIQPPLECVETSTTIYAEPLQLFYAEVYNSYNSTAVPNPADFPMTTLSNTTYVTPKIKADAHNQSMVITVSGLDTSNGNPSISFDDSNITATVVSLGKVNYAVPGNSYPDDYETITVNISAQNAATGLRKLYVTNAGQQKSEPMVALFYIIE